MPQPYQYLQPLPDPIDSFGKYFQLGNSINQSVVAQQQAQEEAKRQQTLRDAMARLNSPDATAKDYQALALLLPPEQAKSVRETFSMMESDRQQTALANSGPVFSAFRSGRPDVAIDLMTTQAEAKRRAGDEEGAKFLETWRDIAKENPKVTEDMWGFTIAQIPGGDKVIDTVLKYEKQAFDILREDLDRLATEEGKIPAAKRPEAEDSLRKEYLKETANFQLMKQAYQNVLNAQPDAAGDLDLIYGYMKMLDPPSVVRESESQMITNSGSVSQSIVNLYNKVLEGKGLLGEDQRKMFTAQIKDLYKGAEAQEKVVREGLTRIGADRGLDTSKVFYEPKGVTEPKTTLENPVAPKEYLVKFKDKDGKETIGAFKDKETADKVAKQYGGTVQP